jgi:hypothetical protein
MVCPYDTLMLMLTPPLMWHVNPTALQGMLMPFARILYQLSLPFSGSATAAAAALLLPVALLLLLLLPRCYASADLDVAAAGLDS